MQRWQRRVRQGLLPVTPSTAHVYLWSYNCSVYNIAGSARASGNKSTRLSPTHLTNKSLDTKVFQAFFGLISARLLWGLMFRYYTPE